MTSTEPLLATAEPRSTRTVAAVTVLYVIVTMTSLVVASLTSFTDIRLLGTVLALLGQLVFLVPYLRRHLQAVAVWITSGLCMAASGLFFAYLGSYFLAGLVSQQITSDTENLWAIAAFIATCSALLALSVGTIVVGLAASTSARWTTLAVMGIVVTGIVALSEPVAYLLAP